MENEELMHKMRCCRHRFEKILAQRTGRGFESSEKVCEFIALFVAESPIYAPHHSCCLPCRPAT